MFWAIKSYNRRRQYISDLITFEEKRVIRVRKPNSNKCRSGTAVYYFRIHNKLECTCKDCFRRTLDVSNKFIEIILKKKRNSTVSGIMELDGRGGHANRKKNDANKKTAKEHILSIPSYEGSRTTGRR